MIVNTLNEEYETLRPPREEASEPTVDQTGTDEWGLVTAVEYTGGTKSLVFERPVAETEPA